VSIASGLLVAAVITVGAGGELGHGFLEEVPTFGNLLLVGRSRSSRTSKGVAGQAASVAHKPSRGGSSMPGTDTITKLEPQLRHSRELTRRPSEARQMRADLGRGLLGESHRPGRSTPTVWRSRAVHLPIGTPCGATAIAASAASTTSSHSSWVRRASRAETVRPASTASRNAPHMAVNPR
jgi:hypothetical protein